VRAVFLEGPHRVRIGALDEPVPGDGELLLEVAAVGICGSDLHYYLEGAIGDQVPAEGFVPGHEFAARVIDARARQFGFEPGELVAVDPAVPCGSCPRCREGHVNLCPHVRFMGAPPFAGAMRERICAPAGNLHRLPAGFDAVAGLMLEPLGVAVHAVALARPRRGESCMLLGCGPIGLLLLQVARSEGVAPLVAVDPIAERREMARTLGADATAATVAEACEHVPEGGADLVLEATDAAEAFELAAEAARPGGRIVLVGIPQGNRYHLEAALARRKGLSVKFSRRMGHVYPRAIALARSGAVELERLVTHRFPLEAAADAFALQAARAEGIVKAALFPDGPPP